MPLLMTRYHSFTKRAVWKVVYLPAQVQDLVEIDLAAPYPMQYFAKNKITRIENRTGRSRKW